MTPMNEKHGPEDDQYIRDKFLKNSPPENYPNDLFDEKCPDVAQAIVALIKKENMTYVDAYASLQLAYKQLKYESNFVQVR